jgi:cytochrome c-type protein NapB
LPEIKKHKEKIMKKIVLSIAALTASTALMAAVEAGACLGCHGADWSKAALGKSKNVAAMSKADIAAALKGYKAGTYGGPMKGLMTGQVAKYSDADLEAFAQTIGK